MTYKRLEKLTSRKGAALLIAIVVLVFVLIAAIATVTFAYGTAKYSAYIERHVMALDEAESGLNMGIYYLNRLGADLPEEITLPSYETRGEIVEWLRSLGSIYYREEGKHRFYLTSDDEVLGLGHQLQDYRAVKVGYLSYYTPGEAPSALYIDADTVDSTYNGNAFRIDGRDHTISGAPTSGTDKPGVVTTDDDATTGVIDGLSGNQRNKIRGSTPSPSVVTDPSVPVDVPAFSSNLDEIADYVYDGPTSFTGDMTFGAEDYPVIVVINGDLTVGGTVEGYGILSIRGSLLSGYGTTVWHGLMIIEGETVWIHGTPDVIGALWVKSDNVNLRISGNPNILYSTEAISNLGRPGYYIDRPSWEEL